MKKGKHKKTRGMKKNKAKEKNLKLLGIFLVTMGIAIAYSAFYILTNSDNGKNNKTVFNQGATTLLDHCAGVCNQRTTNAGDVVISYNGDIMVSGAGEWDGNNFPKTKDKSVNIPAGRYIASLESYDNFVGRAGDAAADQTHEQYYVVFKNGNNEIARTGTTGDLEDGVEEASNITVTNNSSHPVLLSNDVNKITIVHAGSSSQKLKHGFEPVCMLLKRIEEPTCPDGIVNQSSEECDDGNSKNGDGCSSDCKNEVAPTCPDGIVNQSSEECDDGNSKNGDGCSSSCKKERKKEEKKESCDSSIGNYVWYDTNGNGIQEDIEEGIEGIKVCAFKGNKKYCDTTNKHGKYKIDDLCAGNYDVRVKGVGGMVQTYDPDGKKDNKTKVKLKNGDDHTKADFGYRGGAPKTGLATNIALLIGLSTLITIGILMVMRKKGAL